MKLIVNPYQRAAKQRAHTATHLLHAELAQLLPQTRQMGSLVDEDYLRFDFQSDDMMAPEQIAALEKNINDVKQFLSKKKISFAVLGKFSGDQINIRRKSKNLAKFKINLAQKRYFNGLGDLLKHG